MGNKDRSANGCGLSRHRAAVDSETSSDMKRRRRRWSTRPSSTRSSAKMLGDLGGAFSVLDGSHRG